MMVNEQMFDLNDSQEVEIQIRSDGKAVWVNVDGICRVRVNNPVKIRHQCDALRKAAGVKENNR